MSRLKLNNSNSGFTIVELLVVMALIGITVASFASFFTNYLILYTKYQQDATNYTELSSQSQRIADVLRGLTDIVAESANSITMYAYFSPVDTYTSQVKYYLSADGKSILVDVSPMTANPPNGTVLTAKTKTYKIITNFYQPTGTSLFTYYDASNTALTLPIADEHSIQQIQVSLAEPGSHTTNGQTLSITVSLRNRKTNL